MTDEPIDAKSRDGITIGLIDAMIAMANTLNERLKNEQRRHNRLRANPKTEEDEWAWHSEPVREALSDLAGNKAIHQLLYPRDERVMRILHEAAALHQSREKIELGPEDE